MSRKKQQELYPTACEAHEKWERGEIDITESECLVEGLQKARDYYNQVKSFIDSLPDGGIYVLCGTRSDLSCIHNVFLQNDPDEYKGYKYYNFTYAGTTEVAYDSNNKVVQHRYSGITNMDNAKQVINVNILARGMFMNEQYLGQMVKVKMDRPLGTLHPKHGFVYEVNYGYIPGTISGDGEELDAYVLGVHKPLDEFEGEVVAIIHRINDDDDKLVVMEKGRNYTDDQIRALVEFQEQWFQSIIIR